MYGPPRHTPIQSEAELQRERAELKAWRKRKVETLAARRRAVRVLRGDLTSPPNARIGRKRRKALGGLALALRELALLLGGEVAPLRIAAACLRKVGLLPRESTEATPADRLAAKEKELDLPPLPDIPDDVPPDTDDV